MQLELLLMLKLSLLSVKFSIYGILGTCPHRVTYVYWGQSLNNQTIKTNLKTVILKEHNNYKWTFQCWHYYSGYVCNVIKTKQKKQWPTLSRATKEGVLCNRHNESKKVVNLTIAAGTAPPITPLWFIVVKSHALLRCDILFFLLLFISS